MLWAGSETGDLYLSGSTLARREAGAVTVHVIESDWRTAPDALFAELAASPLKLWRVWLGGRCFKLQAVEPIEGVRSIEEAEAALAALLSPVGEPIQVRLAVWPAPRGALWVAGCTPAGLPEILTGAARDAARRILSIRPWWMAPRLPASSAMAWCDDEAVSYYRCDAQGWPVAAGSLQPQRAARPATLRRLRATGRLDVFELDLHQPMSPAQAGFGVRPLVEEDQEDGAASPSV